jgi:hypothetical protein
MLQFLDPNYKLPIYVKQKVLNVLIVGFVNWEIGLWKWEVSIFKNDHTHNYQVIDDEMLAQLLGQC